MHCKEVKSCIGFLPALCCFSESSFFYFSLYMAPNGVVWNAEELLCYYLPPLSSFLIYLTPMSNSCFSNKPKVLFFKLWRKWLIRPLIMTDFVKNIGMKELKMIQVEWMRDVFHISTLWNDRQIISVYYW